MKNGEIYYIDFSGFRGSEINSIHLGIVFSLPKVQNMLFCIPLTSPREKHFKSNIAFINRNHNELKYQNLIYIDQTDSIALLDQIRMISIKRVLQSYKINTKRVLLNELNINLLQIKVTKYLKNIIK